MARPLDIDVSSIEELEAQVAAMTGEDIPDKVDLPIQEDIKEEEAVVENIPQEDEVDKAEVDDEELAAKQGWKEDGELGAGEFLRRGELLDKISSLNKEMKRMGSSLDHQNKYMQKQQEIGYQKALTELEHQKVEAIQMGDVDKVNSLEKEIRNNEANKPEQVDNELPEVQQFKERHASWINDPSLESEDMRLFVAERDVALTKYNLSPADHLKTLEKDLRQKFPEKFVHDRAMPSQGSVETSTAKTVTKAKHTYNDLTSAQKQVCKQFERRGMMTRNEYIAQLKELGEL